MIICAKNIILPNLNLKTYYKHISGATILDLFLSVFIDAEKANYCFRLSVNVTVIVIMVISITLKVKVPLVYSFITLTT